MGQRTAIVAAIMAAVSLVASGPVAAEQDRKGSKAPASFDSPKLDKDSGLERDPKAVRKPHLDESRGQGGTKAGAK